ncbi:Insulinase family protein (peptidase M16) [Candidatus Bealeia paramacronuclearis]|uniref:Insulinase family protein (Peptidase M16) n=1 Tax=Candidatus Bealeia paramacronuclearis TaxID=1921001 RepID=A0ABZ2C0P8_9PROT|nr:Insulinase family protein (peptidase M16) [Candidatus Bealeia paramacronuclearis]
MSIHISTLSNGLQIVTEKLEGVQTAALGLWVGSGSRIETAPKNGIAHFLEHMAFKGTKARTALQIAEEIENVGGHLNAYTSRENTAYYARVLGQDTGLALEIIGDILQNSTFAEDEIARERDVILQEIGQAYDTPDDIIFDYFQETAFPNQSLGRPVLGSAETVSAIGPEDLFDHIQNNYSAKNSVFVATGAINHDEIVSQCESIFERLPGHTPQAFEQALYQGGTCSNLRPELEQVHLVMGFESIPYDHPDYYAYSLISSLLGGGMSSRLFQEVREKRGLVYSVYSFFSPFTDTGLFGIYAGTGAHQLEELRPVVDDVLEDFSKTVSQKELDRSKAQLKTGLMMALESTSGRCEQLAQQMLIYGRPLDPEDIISKVEAVTLEDIKMTSQDLFARPRTTTTVGPCEI